MTSTTPSRRAILAAALTAALVSGSAVAADLPQRIDPVAPAVQPSPYSFTVYAYLWATGLEGRLRTLPPLPAARVSIGFDQVLQNLDGAFMGAAEARFDRAILFLDLMATKVAPRKTLFPAGFPLGLKLDSSSFVGLAAAGYRLIDDPGYSIDGFVGVRGFALNTALTAQIARVSVKTSESEQWADAVAGARLKVNLTPSLYATLMGFAGGGGARYEWDVFGGLGYAFDSRWSAFAGYRAFKVDYRNRPFVYDVLQQGPVLGFSARF